MGESRRVDRWAARPVLAGLVRAGLLVVPLAAALVAVRVLHSLMLHELDLWLQITCTAVAAVAVSLLTERATRRFLPLPALLRMSMLFPGRAPSRLLVTRRANSSVELRRMLEARNPDPQQAATAMMALIGALAAHDKRSRGHSERVRLFTDMVAEEMSLPRGDRDRLCWSALLHDVGKLEIAGAILNKPGQLTESEWERMRRHPADGARLCAALLPWLGKWGSGIAEHHEKYDGMGYPLGLAGEQISLAGRVISVVDAYETMTAARSYRKPITTRAAREELARCASTHFDPAVVRAFLAVSVPRMMWATGPLSLLTHLPYLRDLQLIGTKLAVTTTSSAVQVAGVTAVAVGTAVLPATATVAVAAPSAALTQQVVRGHSATADMRDVARSAAATPPAARPGAARRQHHKKAAHKPLVAQAKTSKTEQASPQVLPADDGNADDGKAEELKSRATKAKEPKPKKAEHQKAVVDPAGRTKGKSDKDKSKKAGSPAASPVAAPPSATTSAPPVPQPTLASTSGDRSHKDKSHHDSSGHGSSGHGSSGDGEESGGDD